MTLRESGDLQNRADDTRVTVGDDSDIDPSFGLNKDQIDHVIVLVHGIRDIGAWQSNVSSQLAVRGTVVKQLRYGLYPAIRFLFPLNLSRKPVARLVDDLVDLREEYKFAKFSVIAHSFGTYVTLRAMRKDPNIKFWKMVFCGSVADDQTRWPELKRRIGDGERSTSDFVLNDCGTSDIWPVVGAAFGWYYGMAGTTGFSEGFVTNRFHRINGGGHSLYFDKSFVREKWRPFLIDDVPPRKGDGEQGQDLPWPIKWLYNGIVRSICKMSILLVWCLIPLIPISLIPLAAWAAGYFDPGIVLVAKFTDRKERIARDFDISYTTVNGSRRYTASFEDGRCTIPHQPDELDAFDDEDLDGFGFERKSLDDIARRCDLYFVPLMSSPDGQRKTYKELLISDIKTLPQFEPLELAAITQGETRGSHSLTVLNRTNDWVDVLLMHVPRAIDKESNNNTIFDSANDRPQSPWQLMLPCPPGKPSEPFTNFGFVTGHFVIYASARGQVPQMLVKDRSLYKCPAYTLTLEYGPSGKFLTKGCLRKDE